MKEKVSELDFSGADTHKKNWKVYTFIDKAMFKRLRRCKSRLKSALYFLGIEYPD